MAFPESQDPKLRKLTNMLVRYAETEGLVFSLDGEKSFPQEVFGHFGCLAFFLIEAKELYEKIYNKKYSFEDLMSGIGRNATLNEEQLRQDSEYLSGIESNKLFPIKFVENSEKTYFGFEPQIVEGMPDDFIILTHFTHCSVEEYVKAYKKNKEKMLKGEMIPIEPLYRRIVEKINSGLIEIKPSATVPTVGNI